MPLQNGTQKDVGLGPDFRRDDEEWKPQKEGNKGLQPLVLMHSRSSLSQGVETPCCLFW